MPIEITSLEEAGLYRPQISRLDHHLEAYVDQGKLAGFALVIARDGAIAHRHTYGMADLATGQPILDDTIYRIYSMTKPITSVVAMSLVEEGRIDLDDEGGSYIPSFKEIQVLESGSILQPRYRPAVEPVRIWHLLTHTSGLTYGFHNQTVLDSLYRHHSPETSSPTLAQLADSYANLGLLFDPGTGWNYSVATDVLGRVIEVVTGEPLSEVFSKKIFDPLGMSDTSFELSDDHLERVAALYGRAEDAKLHRLGGPVPEKRVYPYDSGGGGLFSTVDDYLAFAITVLDHGQLDGARLLGPRTVDLMTSNHLPGGSEIRDLCFSRPQPSDTPGVGFGLGFSVVLDPVAARNYSYPGEFGWGGMASTTFFAVPSEQLAVIFMTQLLPSSTYELRKEIHQLLLPALSS